MQVNRAGSVLVCVFCEAWSKYVVSDIFTGRNQQANKYMHSLNGWKIWTLFWEVQVVYVMKTMKMKDFNIVSVVFSLIKNK